HEAAFYWLYTHEHEWLEEVLPIATKTQHVERVNWTKRDTEVVMSLKYLLNSLDKIPSRTSLDSMLGGHGWLTSKLAYLPKTQRLLRLMMLSDKK
ncbi:transposase, partial [Vibrio lentus]